MRRMAWITAWIAGSATASVAMLLAIVLILGNTASGRHLIEKAAAKLSGGAIGITGLGGRFPDRLRADRVTLRSGGEAWLDIDRLNLDWSPWRLVTGDLAIGRLAADAATLEHLPASASSGETSGGAPPLRVDIDRLAVGKLTLAPAVAGARASLALAGELHIQSEEDARFALEARRLDRAGRYAALGSMTQTRIDAQLEASEPAGGLLSELSGMSGIGPVSFAAKLEGKRSDESLSLALGAGPARVDGKGTLDLDARRLDLDLAANAPAMSPRDDLRWQSVKIDAHIHGSFERPEARATLAIARLAIGAAGFESFNADLRGDGGALTLDGAITALRLPGAAGDLLALAPLKLHAEAALDQASRPVTFALSHPLIAASGRATTAEGIDGSAEIKLGALKPFSGLAGTALEGNAQLTADFAAGATAMRLGLDGTAHLTGENLAAKLLGDARITLKAARQGETTMLENASIAGKALRASASGATSNGALDGRWSLALADLTPLAPQLTGSLEARGRLSGAPDHATLAADLAARIGTAAIRPTSVTATLRLDDVPGSPKGEIAAQGDLLGGALNLAANFDRESGGTLNLAVARLDWKSAKARGRLTLPAGARLPLGQMTFSMTQIDELEPLLGERIAGSLEASLATRQAQPRPQMQLQVDAQHLALGASGIGRLTAAARIDDPLGAARLSGKLEASGIAAAGIGGSGKIEADGPIDALGLRLAADLTTGRGPATLSASGIANLPQRRVQIAALDASFAGETAHLLRPATIETQPGLAVKALRLGLDGAALDLDGSVTPALDLTASLRNFKPAQLQPFLPAIKAGGVIDASAKLAGSLDAPTGTIRLTGRDLQLTGGAARGLAVASIEASAALNRTSAALDLRLAGGKGLNLRVSGTVPLQSASYYDLRASGTLDLAMLDPVLTPGGRSLRGALRLDLGIAGSFAEPDLSGSVTLAEGAFHDYVQGVDLADIGGRIVAEGQRLRVRLEGRAGAGRLSVSGTVAPLSADLPVDLTIAAENARAIESDLITARLSGTLKLQGDVRTELRLAGEIKVERADVTLPESLPQNIAVLNVQRPGQAQPEPSAPLLVIVLDLGVSAPEQIFVRGHGIDAEFGGALQVKGTNAAPQIGGGFNLRRGTFNLAGHTLTFTAGKVTFNGSSPGAKLDPALDLTAETTANGVTATLKVTGYADQPKIALSSAPPLPQDEILAQLFFGQSVKQLTPLQVAEIAQALASLSGLGGPNPLATLRNALGLDRLSVSGAAGNTAGTTVEAGKYIAGGVYVGAKQGVSGGTQGQVQIDLTRNLKLQTTLATGGGQPATGATPENDPGSSIGLMYQFEY